MNRLVVGNLVHRPMRSLISTLAVAIEVTMILSIAGIMLGMLNGSKDRTSGIGLDMFVRPSSTTNFAALSSAAASVKVADVLGSLPHIAVAAPVNVQMSAGTSLENIYGIDYKSFNALRPFVFIQGGPFQGPDDVIIDDIAAGSLEHSGKGHNVGDTIEILHHPFRISGIVEHGKGGRKFIPLETLGEITNNPGKANAFYLKLDNLNNVEAVKKEIASTPGMSQYDAQSLKEWLSVMTPEHLPGFSIAINSVIGIAVIIGFLVIFQSMYTAVMERTREIGVLKSLGASRSYIVSVVLRETGVLAVAGIILGIALTYFVRFLIHIKSTLDFAVTPQWVFRAVLIAFFGAIFGALYPALKAARKDPIDALSYE